MWSRKFIKIAKSQTVVTIAKKIFLPLKVIFIPICIKTIFSFCYPFDAFLSISEKIKKEKYILEIDKTFKHINLFVGSRYLNDVNGQ